MLWAHHHSRPKMVCLSKLIRTLANIYLARITSTLTKHNPPNRGMPVILKERDASTQLPVQNKMNVNSAFLEFWRPLRATRQYCSQFQFVKLHCILFKFTSSRLTLVGDRICLGPRRFIILKRWIQGGELNYSWNKIMFTVNGSKLLKYNL